MTDASPGRFESLKSSSRIWRFLVVGIIGFIIDQSVLILLIELTDITLEIGKIIAAEVAIILMFVINDHWTFARWGSRSTVARFRRLVKSNAVRVGGIVVAVVVLSVLVRGFGMAYPVANAIGIFCGFIVNYTFETIYTWRVGQ